MGILRWIYYYYCQGSSQREAKKGRKRAFVYLGKVPRLGRKIMVGIFVIELGALRGTGTRVWGEDRRESMNEPNTSPMHQTRKRIGWKEWSYTGSIFMGRDRDSPLVVN